ncbi:hypothetical protein CPC16_006196 [Podila verticillata]|nr:hypothetical protein CPC16_006196 [Podila verticillata]
MHVGRLPQDVDTIVVCTDKLEDENEASLEDLFLVGHRYNVPQLYNEVVSLILQKLDAFYCIAFLFRSAYMFNELREPVIEIVAKARRNQIVKRAIAICTETTLSIAILWANCSKHTISILEFIKSVKWVAWLIDVT